MDINERFETIIKILFRGNKRAFAKAVGISPTVVENIVGTRRGKPSFDVLVKVCSNANISAEWLLLGIGEQAMDMFNIRKDLTIPVYDEKNSDPDKPILTTTFTAKKDCESPKRGLDEDDIEDLEGNNMFFPNEATLINYLNDKLDQKDIEMCSLHEEIGKLKERIDTLEREKNELKIASLSNTRTSKEPSAIP